jgi:predicted nuclease with TOPRIM domain
LRKDGRQGTNDLASQFLHLIKQVTDSRKVDVLELQGQLQKSQQEMMALEDSKTRAEAKLQAALKELEAMKTTSQQQLQMYRANLGLAPQK